MKTDKEIWENVARINEKKHEKNLHNISNQQLNTSYPNILMSRDGLLTPDMHKSLTVLLLSMPLLDTND